MEVVVKCVGGRTLLCGGDMVALETWNGAQDVRMGVHRSGGDSVI